MRNRKKEGSDMIGRQPVSVSIADFCERHHISGATFYRNRMDMPRTIRIGGQVRILAIDEDAWVKRKQEERR
jgi:predicted DNA-binding transcriptional regulator AlpA